MIKFNKTKLMSVIVTLVFIFLGISSYIFFKNTSPAKANYIHKTEPIFVQKSVDFSMYGFQNIGLFDESMDDVKDFQHALDTAPKGLKIKPYFQLGNFAGNTAKIINKKNETADDASILNVTDSTNELGAIWSDMSKNNYFDLSIDQTMSMWLYFGRSTDPTSINNAQNIHEVPQRKTVGDGMALVFQNGGLESIAHFGNKLGYGESLGVWGTDFDNNHQHQRSDIAKTAIQNSLAIEFDTFSDNSTKFEELNNLGVSFDTIPKEQHIAIQYPGDPNTYIPSSVKRGGQSRYFFTMFHDNPVSELHFSDGKWHHLTIKWNSNKKNLTYFFDDKSENDNEQVTSPIHSRSKIIDISKFNFKDSSQKKLRWGFTGSTGKYSENNMIVFESIPSFANAELKTEIQNETTKTNFTPYKNSAHSGDVLDFTYDLTYTSGNKDWNNIAGTINLPSQVKYKSGYIKYRNDNNQMESIDGSLNKDNQLKFRIKKSLNKNLDHATVVLKTEVLPVAVTTSVSKQHVRFEGDTLIVNGWSPDFRIMVNPFNFRAEPVGATDFENIDTVPNEIIVNCYAWYGNAKFDPSNIRFKPKLNEQNLPIINADARTSITYPTKLSIDKKYFKSGFNTLVIQAYDAKNPSLTAEQSIIYSVGRMLRFGVVNKNVQFRNIKGLNTFKYISRVNDWRTEIIDTRRKGNGWTLEAKEIPTENSGLFNGYLVYVDEFNHVHRLNNSIAVAHAIKESEDDKVTDIINNWSKNNGILLYQKSTNPKGKYSFGILWTLVDGIH